MEKLLIIQFSFWKVYGRKNVFNRNLNFEKLQEIVFLKCFKVNIVVFVKNLSFFFRSRFRSDKKIEQKILIIQIPFK